MLNKTISAILIFIICSTAIFSQGIGTWKTYTSKKEIVSVTAKSDNEIWCATSGGAFMYDAVSGSFLQLSSSEGLTNPKLTSVAVDNLDQVWFGTFVGSEPGMVNVYNSLSGVVNKINDIYNSDFSQKNINDITSTGDTILVSTDFGLSLLNPTNYSFYDTFVKFGDFDATLPVVSASLFDRFYVITDDGIAVQKSNSTNLTAPEAWQSFYFGSGILTTTAYEFTQFDGNTLVATDKGIFRFENGTWQLFLMDNTNVENIYASGNNLYFTASESSNSKIYNYDGTNVNTIFNNDDSYELTDLYVTTTGVVYTGTSTGLLKIESGTSDLLIPTGPANNAFVSLATDNSGSIWVGTGRDVYGIGVMSFDGTDWDLLSTSSNPNVISNAYHKVYAHNNDKYFCNWGQGLTVLSNDSLTNYTAASTGIAGIPSDPNFLVVKDVKVDTKGNIWILNHTSADAAPLSTITTSGEVYSFPNSIISETNETLNLAIDQYGTKWFSVITGNTGLYYFNENGTYDNTGDDVSGRLRTSDGLSSNTVSALALDNLGSLWVGTNVGVNILYNPSDPTSQISTVTALAQQTVTDIVVDPLNQKWVGTVQGLFHLSQDGTFVYDYYTSENSPLPSNDIKSIAIDAESGIVYVGTDFGLAALMTSSVAPNENMDDLFVFPNPVIINNTAPNITIQGLISDTSIKVLSVSGKLIAEFETPGGSVGFWDGKDSDGNFVPSGVYIIVAYDEDGANVASTKVAVLRQ